MSSDKDHLSRFSPNGYNKRTKEGAQGNNVRGGRQSKICPSLLLNSFVEQWEDIEQDQIRIFEGVIVDLSSSFTLFADTVEMLCQLLEDAFAA